MRVTIGWVARLRWVREYRVALGAGLALLLVLGLFGTKGMAKYKAEHPGGTHRDASITWECNDAIEWAQPDTDYVWWAGPEASPSPLLPTFTEGEPAAGYGEWRADGVMSFEDNDSAIFTSDRGGVIALERFERDDITHQPTCQRD